MTARLTRFSAAAMITSAALGAWLAPPAARAQVGAGHDGPPLLSIDHYVRHESTVPGMAGEVAQLYVRERVKASILARGEVDEDRVVLFVHGAGTPAEVAFDVPHEGYSWMAHLAEAGFDVFSMDMTGYGRSTRPYAMNDPCNLDAEQRAAVFGGPAVDCASSSGSRSELTTIATDWADIDAVVEHLRRLRQVARVSLIGWSLGGPRAGGYAAQHPEKINRLVLLAPAYSRDLPAERPSSPSSDGAMMTAQSRADFDTNWDRQVGCADQYDPAVSTAVWREMLASDPVGATWGPGVRRAPRTAVWGWNQAMVRNTSTPTLLVAAAHDAQIAAERVRDLYEDLGAREKVLIDLGCASHNAMWERAHRELFRASLAWLRDGAVDDMSQGILHLNYGAE